MLPNVNLPVANRCFGISFCHWEEIKHLKGKGGDGVEGGMIKKK